jgi:hypothetical protein
MQMVGHFIDRATLALRMDSSGYRLDRGMGDPLRRSERGDSAGIRTLAGDLNI